MKFIKFTTVRDGDGGIEIKEIVLHNLDDIKIFRQEKTGVIVYYKSYSDIGEEYDQIDEDMKIIALRLELAGAYSLPTKIHLETPKI